MAVERKKEQDKGPAELAAEKTAKDKAAKQGDEPKARQSKPRSQRKPAEAKASAAKGETQAKPKAKPKPAAKPKAQAGSAEKAKAAPKRETAKADEPEKGAPSTRRRRAPARRPSPPREAVRPVVRAQAKYVRSSARKARLVIEHIRGKSVEDARAVLRHTPRGVARDIEKLLASAVANAENNHELVGDDLLVKEAYADEGPTLKRFRPRALGRATRIRKRTSHLTLTLTPKD
jgi:ribosomal protein L22